MATYSYRCKEHDGFDVSRPLGTAPDSVACPQCGAASHRVITAPMVLRSSRSAWSAAIDHAEKSRHEPEVVSSLPPTGGGRIGGQALLDRNPRLAGLPRP